MSTLNVANISDGTDTVETGYVVNGAAKAWVNYNTITTVSINDSFGVSSLTDVSGGVTDINFTSAFSDTNYTFAGATHNFHCAIGPTGTSTARCTGFYVNGLGGQRALYDIARVGNIYHGDLA